MVWLSCNNAADNKGVLTDAPVVARRQVVAENSHSRTVEVCDLVPNCGYLPLQAMNLT